jgi:hypothetical protein
MEMDFLLESSHSWDWFCRSLGLPESRSSPARARWKASQDRLRWLIPLRVIFDADAHCPLLGGTMYSWSSWHTLVPLILGAAGLAAFTVHQVDLGSESSPAEKRLDTLLPMRIFANRSTSITYMNTFLHGMILWSIVYYMPFYFQPAKSYSPIQTGLTALPQTLTVVPCAMVVGVVSSKTGRYRWSLLPWICI